MKWTPELRAMKDEVNGAYAAWQDRQDEVRAIGASLREGRQREAAALGAASDARLSYQDAEVRYQKALGEAGGLPKV